jgi:adenine-specific DNA-methyltransferase
MIKGKNKDDDKALMAINEIENALTEKKYGLVWEQHEEAVDVKMQTHIPVFTEDKNREITMAPGEYYNFLLEGDNLHSLYLLEKTHKGKIDVIYIDPPYNRGKNDFKYDDNFIDRNDSFKHSKWISFLRERLNEARSLLSEKGIICISIDDNEFAQLKMLMDEIFGEDCFLNMFVWKRNSSVKTDKEKFTVNTEYVFLYSHTKQYYLNSVYKPLSESTRKMYSKDDKDGRGPYRLYPLQKPKSPGPETTYDYVDNNGKVWKCPPKGWRIKYDKLKALENDGRLCLANKSLSEKAYWNERENEGKRIDTLWDDLSENSTGSKELRRIIGEQNVFDNPKPIDLIQRCIKIADKENSIVLDFFAGSGTTAQAVLALNKEDGGQRRFILCTNNENSICEDVTYPRVKTVITGIRPDGGKYSDGIPANLKYYRTGFVSKNEEFLSDVLLNHIAEMIQLEHGIKLDGKQYIMVMSDEEADKLAAHWNEYPEVKVLYVSKNVLLTTEQEQLFKNIKICIIPDYYFDFELQEVGESW